jgi:uncharacterized membrane protein
MDDPLGRIEQLERSVKQLESQLAYLRNRIENSPTVAPVARPSQVVAAWPAPTPRSAAQPYSSRPTTNRADFELDSEAVLKWGGVGLVVLAVGFALSTAISRGWIGPELQLVGALVVAAGLIGSGLRLQTSRPAWTHALCSGGVLALFTTVASSLFLDQFNDDAALICIVAIGLGACGLSRVIPSEWLAGAALLGGLTAWFVVADGDLPIITSSIWFAVLVAAVIALCVEQGWFTVRLVAGAAGLIVILVLADEGQDTAERVAVLVAAALLYCSFVRVPSIGNLSSTVQQIEVQLAATAGPWAFAAIAIAFDLDDDASVGSVALGAAAATALVAYAARRWIHQAHVVSLLIGASVSLSIGLAILLSTTATFVALAVQGVGLIILSRTLGNSIRVVINAAAALVIASVFDVGDMINAWSYNDSVGDDVIHLAIIVALAVAAWQSRNRDVQRVGAVVVLAMLLIWLGSVLVHLPQGQAVVSVSWAVVGTVLLVVGAVRKRPDVGMVALIVLGLTVAKLLTVDLQEVDRLWRAGLFLLIGLAFLRLGFLLPRLTGGRKEPDA